MIRSIVDPLVSGSEFSEIVKENSSSDVSFNFNISGSEVEPEQKIEEFQTSITPSNSNGLKKILIEIIGDHEVDYKVITYTSASGYASTTVATCPDYPWIITCCFFCLCVLVCLFATFRSIFSFLGGVIYRAHHFK